MKAMIKAIKAELKYIDWELVIPIILLALIALCAITLIIIMILANCGIISIEQNTNTGINNFTTQFNTFQVIRHTLNH